jgi:hypothetical protein
MAPSNEQVNNTIETPATMTGGTATTIAASWIIDLCENIIVAQLAMQV